MVDDEHIIICRIFYRVHAPQQPCTCAAAGACRVPVWMYVLVWSFTSFLYFYQHTLVFAGVTGGGLRGPFVPDGVCAQTRVT
jgi:O-antigen ligase